MAAWRFEDIRKLADKLGQIWSWFRRLSRVYKIYLRTGGLLINGSLVRARAGEPLFPSVSISYVDLVLRPIDL